MIAFILVAVVLLVIFLRPRYKEPRVIKGVFTRDQCEKIIQMASKRLEPSSVSWDMEVDRTIRKSETAWLSPHKSPLVRDVMQKCISMTDRPFRNSEHLQVLKYKPGGFYSVHHDAFEYEKTPRVFTAIIALNDDYTGGGTGFPTLNRVYKLNQGDVLLFNTLNDWGLHTDKALHAGMPVKSGEKWICNLWIHRHAYSLKDDEEEAEEHIKRETGGSCSAL